VFGPGISVVGRIRGYIVYIVCARFEQKKGKTTMLYTIAVVLILLWLLGFVSAYTLGGFIHVLLVIAIVVILLRVISGRRPI
jgi:asparagine N-glycosylation enzyme membrane subunit Stt3